MTLTLTFQTGQRITLNCIRAEVHADYVMYQMDQGPVVSVSSIGIESATVQESR